MEILQRSNSNSFYVTSWRQIARFLRIDCVIREKKIVISFVMSKGACKNYITFYLSDEAVTNFRKNL